MQITREQAEHLFNCGCTIEIRLDGQLDGTWQRNEAWPWDFQSILKIYENSRFNDVLELYVQGTHATCGKTSDY